MTATFKAFLCILFAVMLSIAVFNIYTFYRRNPLSLLVKSREVRLSEDMDHNLISSIFESDEESEEADVLRSQSIQGLDYLQAAQVSDNIINPRVPTTPNQTFSGHILALKIYEQQTMASGNLLQLQCFARILGLSVVQPFMKDSCLVTPLLESYHSRMLQLEDIFDMQEWRKYAEQKGYAPLVKWKEFVVRTPQNVILVQMKYPTLNRVKYIRKNGGLFSSKSSENGEYKRGCGYKVVKRTLPFLRRNGFHVVRTVCFNFLSGIEVSLEAFRAHLFGDYDPNTVTVIVDEWRGLGEQHRVPIQERICQKSQTYRLYSQPSLRILENAQLYVDRYLRNGSSKEYLAIIARYEMTGLTRKVNSEDPHAIIPYCLQKTLDHSEKMLKSSGLTQIFLSADIGRYGSRSFLRKHYFGHLQEMESFIGKVYRDKMNIGDWERTFEDIAQVFDSGYIAKLQQAIVVKAKCILFVGGGTFQEHTLHLYQKLHPNPSDRCIEVINKCTSKNRPIQ